MDIETRKLNPTWSNKRTGEDRVAKRLDQFLIQEPLMDDAYHFFQWVNEGGESFHHLIVMKFGHKLSTHFKFNLNWFEDEYFVSLVEEK